MFHGSVNIVPPTLIQLLAYIYCVNIYKVSPIKMICWVEVGGHTFELTIVMVSNFKFLMETE